MNFKGVIDEVLYHDSRATIFIAGGDCPALLVVENPPADYALVGAQGLAIAGVGTVVLIEGVVIADRRGNGAVRMRKKRNRTERERRP